MLGLMDQPLLDLAQVLVETDNALLLALDARFFGCAGCGGGFALVANARVVLGEHAENELGVLYGRGWRGRGFRGGRWGRGR